MLGLAWAKLSLVVHVTVVCMDECRADAHALVLCQLLRVARQEPASAAAAVMLSTLFAVHSVNGTV